MDAIAGKVIERLSSLALEEFGLIWNLKDDLKRTKRTISAVKAVLRDAEAKASNHQISNWLEELKDVLYDADDLMDVFSTEALRRKLMTGNKMAKEVRIFFSQSNQIGYGLKMGHKMKEIRKRLDDIAKDKQQLQLADQPVETPVVLREQRQTYSFVRKDEVIGREEEKKLIISYLRDTNVRDCVSIIPVVGIGGLGKTTLAQLVYNDEAVQKYFEQTMWVCVSDEFDIRKIAQKIIGHDNFEIGHDNKSEIEQVVQDQQNKIQGKKYLLVLDDVWNDDRELWLKLKSLLMEGGKGSKIIVTTRSEVVAKIMGTHPPLFLKGLDLKRSWKLFSRVAFDEGKEPNNSELVQIGKDIVKKCGGVPLAIRTIGSLLYSRNLGQSDWEYFRDVEFSKIDQQKDKMFAILKLSYDHLPSYLKNCFAYCSLFPKDFEFDKNTLIQLWVAEGFIQPSDDIRCEEDVGHEYFMNLLRRSFFQDVMLNDWGVIKTCKMHDLIHELAQLVAGNEYTVVSEGKEEKIEKRTRHLSYLFSLHFDQKLASSLLKGDKSRTFILPSQPIWGMPTLSESDFCSFLSLRCLRVLSLYGLDIITIPKSIKKLTHLRYIDLSWNDALEMLPPDITSLHNLQTLKLSHCRWLKELPADINKMRSLRHLELDCCYNLTCMPRGLGQLTCLQTLAPFVLGRGSISELRGLNNLRKLEIKGLNVLRGNIAEATHAKVLLKKLHLRELKLHWCIDHGNKMSEAVASEDKRILEGLQPHHSIQYLVIDGYCGKRLPDWIGNLTSLLVLEINSCYGLRSLPKGVCNLRSLQRLCIFNSTCLWERYQKGVGEDWPKISHIPNVIVY